MSLSLTKLVAFFVEDSDALHLLRYDVENVPDSFAFDNSEVDELHEQKDVVDKRKQHLQDLQFVAQLRIFSPFKNIEE